MEAMRPEANPLSEEAQLSSALVSDGGNETRGEPLERGCRGGAGDVGAKQVHVGKRQRGITVVVFLLLAVGLRVKRGLAARIDVSVAKLLPQEVERESEVVGRRLEVDYEVRADGRVDGGFHPSPVSHWLGMLAILAFAGGTSAAARECLVEEAA